MAEHMSDAVVRRLPAYYRHLRELEAIGIRQISSQELGERMNQTPSQIRQDINCFGGCGRQGFGYSVLELKAHISKILGLDRRHNMIILGAGSIGSAVARYPTFLREGFVVTAMFDVDEKKINTEIAGAPVMHIDALEEFIAQQRVDIAVLAVPASKAQATLNRLDSCGVTAVWNFAPTDLKHPEHMLVMNVHLSDSLKVLSYKMAQRDAEVEAGE